MRSIFCHPFQRIVIGMMIALFFTQGCQPAPIAMPTSLPTERITTPAPTLHPTQPAEVTPTISPLLVGNNVWMYPDSRVWDISAKAGLKLVRIGGIAFDENPPSLTMLTGWINHIKALGAEPMLQVSRFKGPEAAASLVRYFNIEKKTPIKYWNIGNEPFCNKVTATTATEVAAYIKPIATAMKAIDPGIQIFAPDECDFYETYYAALLSGDESPADISGKVPGQDYYYIDGISWHRYIGFPPEKIDIEHLASDGAHDFLVRIQKTRDLIDRANKTRGRSGANALQWGIGEFNSSEGQRVCSFENGQMFAILYGYIMKYGGTYGATWSMFENGGKCFGSDFGFVDGKMQPRSTFYHMQMVSENFSGTPLNATSNQAELRVFGAKDDAKGKITVMLLNIEATVSHTCILSLEERQKTANTCQINIPAGVAAENTLEVPPHTSIILVFDLQGHLLRSISYTKGDPAPRQSE